MTAAPALDLSQVTLEMGGRKVLSDVSLAIGAGEFIGLFGPNGAGKTTLMRGLLGLVPAAKGTIRVLGQKAMKGNPAIGYMPQVRSPLFGSRLSGWDFVAGVADGHRLGLPLLSRRARTEVEWALERVGARDLARRPLAEISGGERQRLLLAQALIGRPPILLLDEPLISLDPAHQQSVVALAKALQSDLGMTVLFSAHEINPLLGALDRVLYLGGGQAALGSVETVITAPVLSRLYGAEIEVVRLKGRIFVLSGGSDVEHDEHRHDGHGHDGHGGHGSHEHGDADG